MHTDQATTPQSDGLLASARARGIPIITAKQLLTWTDGRNGSSFGSLAWSGNTLSFTVGVGSGANGLSGMLPTAGPNGTRLTGISRGGSPVATTVSTVKGIEYAGFTAATGSYTATYGAAPLAISAVDTSASRVTDPSASLSSVTSSEPATTVAWKTTTPSTSQVLLGTSPTDLQVAATEAGSTTRHAVDLTDLKPSTTYYYRVVSTDAKKVRQVRPATTAAPSRFTTPAADRRKAGVSKPEVTPLPGGTAVVSWTTTEPTAAIVRSGRSRARLDQQTRDQQLRTRHSMVVTGLRAGSTYWFDTVSVDAAGNRSVTQDVRFVTPANGVAELMAASFRRGTDSGEATVTDAGDGAVTLAGSSSRARRGTFTSGVLDAQAMVDWDRATADLSVPRGARLALSYRTGSTDEPDGTWSGWQRVGADDRTTGSSRYIQYRAVLSAEAGAAAPSLLAVGFSHNGGPPPREYETR